MFWPSLMDFSGIGGQWSRGRGVARLLRILEKDLYLERSVLFARDVGIL